MEVPAFEIRWKETDVSLFQTHPLTPTLAISVTGSSSTLASSSARKTDDGQRSIFDEVVGTGLSRGSIAGIAVGVSAVVLLISAGVFLLWTRRLNKKGEESA
jgi:hydroxyethylthiazole kinase-like sugar kinase family protein